MDRVLRSRLEAHGVLDAARCIALQHSCELSDVLFSGGPATRAFWADLRDRGWCAENLVRVFGLRDPDESPEQPDAIASECGFSPLCQAIADQEHEAAQTVPVSPPPPATPPRPRRPPAPSDPWLSRQIPESGLGSWRTRVPVRGGRGG